MWNKLKWQLQRFMIGRNGRDELEQACFYLSFVIYIFGDDSFFFADRISGMFGLPVLYLPDSFQKCIQKAGGKQEVSAEAGVLEAENFHAQNS